MARSCLVELYKGKGPIGHCGSFRDIHLKDRTAKVYHSLLRDQLSDAYTAMTLDSQCGGIAGRGTDVASHLCRAFAEHCHFAKKSAFFVYLDLVAAFASIMREMLFTGVRSDAQVCHILNVFGMLPDSFHDLAGWLAVPGTIDAE